MIPQTIDFIRRRGFRTILLTTLLFNSGCSTFNSSATRWFDEPEFRNLPKAKIDPQTGKMLNGGII